MRSRPCGRSTLRTVLASTLAALLASAASAQNPHAGEGAADVPDVAPGDATIVGRLEHPDGAAKTEGATVVLYALASDGRPGMRSTRADARGGFAFTQISNAQGITYLIGASYRGVPYGERATFAPGQSELSIVIEVEEPSSDTSPITVGSSTWKVEWVGSSLGIEEIHQLENPGGAVVYVPPADRAGLTPAFRTRLPAGAGPVDTSLSGVADGYEVDEGELQFWGPIYAGGFELRFRYLIALPRERDGALELRWPLDTGSRDASVVYPSSGPEVRIAGAPPAQRIETGEGALQAFDLGAVEAGRGVAMHIALPPISSDTSAITIPRVDYWLDADDTFLQVNVETYFDVAPGAHLAGDAPLLTLSLPPGAELLGASPEAQDLGVIPLPTGDLGVLGPLSPGRSGFAYRYRVPVMGNDPELDIALPVPVGTMNVLIADTGVIIETERLHRRRPFRQGTRIYLHREAFSVDAGETVSIRLGLLDRASVDARTHLFATSAFAALGVWFIITPLTRRGTTGRGEYERARLRSEREIVYQAIRDLEHDHETGKLESEEYASMRDELRGQAVALLQREKRAEAPGSADPTEPESTPGDDESTQVCPACGTRMEGSWRFCANCGAARPGAGEAPA